MSVLHRNIGFAARPQAPAPRREQKHRRAALLLGAALATLTLAGLPACGAGSGDTAGADEGPGGGPDPRAVATEYLALLSQPTTADQARAASLACLEERPIIRAYLQQYEALAGVQLGGRTAVAPRYRLGTLTVTGPLPGFAATPVGGNTTGRPIRFRLVRNNANWLVCGARQALSEQALSKPAPSKQAPSKQAPSKQAPSKQAPGISAGPSPAGATTSRR